MRLQRLESGNPGGRSTDRRGLPQNASRFRAGVPSLFPAEEQARHPSLRWRQSFAADCHYARADEKLIADALGTVARAKGMSGVARDIGLSREGLYRSLSRQGSAELSRAIKALDSFDMQLVVRPKAKTAA